MFQFPQDIDPCDPSLSRGPPAPQFRVQQKSEHKTQGKSKGSKGKGKGRKPQEDDRAAKPVQKLWYEALSPEGYTYYWHIESNGASTFFHAINAATFFDFPSVR